MLQDRVKEYKNSVIRCLMHKYDLSEFEANKAIRQSYLPDSISCSFFMSKSLNILRSI